MSDPDPREQARARMQAAADQFGAAVGDAFALAMRQALAKSLAIDFGPGPWVLHEDGRVEPPTVVPPPSGPNRILWNQRDDDIDEIVIHAATVHIEQMNDRCWWIGIDVAGGGYWAGNFIAKSRGPMRFTEQEMDGFEWDQDASHDDEPSS